MTDLGASIVVATALSALIGISLGMLGGGGALLLVPTLIYVTRLPAATAIATSLAVVAATSALASYTQHRHGRVRVGTAAMFGGAGIVTSFAGAQFTDMVPERALMLGFAGLMLIVGIWMFTGRREPPARSGPPRLLAIVIAGSAVGALTGFLGVGGGFLIVPALIAFGGLGVRDAIGTSLLVIAINSVAGFAGHLHGSELDLGLVALLTTAAMAGAALGEPLGRRLSVDTLRRGFAALVVAVGVAMAATQVGQALATTQSPPQGDR